jgi:hypothetical protein
VKSTPFVQLTTWMTAAELPEMFGVPAYVAVISLLPGGKLLVVIVALPDFNATEPSVIFPAVNVTVPWNRLLMEGVSAGVRLLFAFLGFWALWRFLGQLRGERIGFQKLFASLNAC